MWALGQFAKATKEMVELGMMAAACVANSVDVTVAPPDADLPVAAADSCRISLPLKKGWSEMSHLKIRISFSPSSKWLVTRVSCDF